jgi:hypothetical protein
MSNQNNIKNFRLKNKGKFSKKIILSINKYFWKPDTNKIKKL